MNDPKYGYPYPPQGAYQGPPPVMAPPQYYAPPPPPQRQVGFLEGCGHCGCDACHAVGRIEATSILARARQINVKPTPRILLLSCFIFSDEIYLLLIMMDLSSTRLFLRFRALAHIRCFFSSLLSIVINIRWYSFAHGLAGVVEMRCNSSDPICFKI